MNATLQAISSDSKLKALRFAFTVVPWHQLFLTFIIDQPLAVAQPHKHGTFRHTCYHSPDPPLHANQPPFGPASIYSPTTLQGWHHCLLRRHMHFRVSPARLYKDEIHPVALYTHHTLWKSFSTQDVKPAKSHYDGIYVYTYRHIRVYILCKVRLLQSHTSNGEEYADNWLTTTTSGRGLIDCLALKIVIACLKRVCYALLQLERSCIVWWLQPWKTVHTWKMSLSGSIFQNNVSLWVLVRANFCWPASGWKRLLLGSLLHHLLGHVFVFVWCVCPETKHCMRCVFLCTGTIYAPGWILRQMQLRYGDSCF